jgi:tetratricopeptide (TPR) repeat protein
MPKTVISLNSTMRDHTLSLPTPENTVAFSIPNACNECHTEKTPAWAVNALNAWWPNGRRARLVRQAEAFTAARDKRPEGLDRLLALASDDSVSALIQATAVGYLRNYSGERARQALLVAAKAEQSAVRVAAISSLGHQPAPMDSPVRSVLLAALDDPRRAIRIAALVSLINVNASGNPLGTVDVERLRRVGHEYAELSSLYEDDASFDRDLGVVHLLTGEFDRAADVLQVCLRLEPDRPSARFLLAFARLGQRRIDEARALLKQVQPSDPMYEAAQRRLKSLAPGSQ